MLTEADLLREYYDGRIDELRREIEGDLDETERWRRLARRRLAHCRVLFGLVALFGAAGFLVGRWWR